MFSLAIELSLPAPATVGLVILLGCAVLMSTALSLYLLFLAVASLVRSRRSATPSAPLTRFAMLIPAHEEELVIGRLLDSVNALDYPHDLYRVDVVADHCTDQTAAIAHGHGAMVHERTDHEPRGKSWSLNALVRDLLKGDAADFVDAFVVVDAEFGNVT